MTTDFILEIIAALFGIHSVFYLGKNKKLGWLTGILNISISIYIYINVQLFGQVFLMFIFLLLSLYGWFSWNNNVEDSYIINATNKDKMYGIGFVLLSSLIIFMLLSKTLDPYPFLDSTIVSLSLIATYWLSKKIIESWIIWSLVNVLSIIMYYQTSQIGFTMYYIVLLVISTMSYFKWNRNGFNN